MNKTITAEGAIRVTQFVDPSLYNAIQQRANGLFAAGVRQGFVQSGSAAAPAASSPIQLSPGATIWQTSPIGVGSDGSFAPLRDSTWLLGLYARLPVTSVGFPASATDANAVFTASIRRIIPVSPAFTVAANARGAGFNSTMLPLGMLTWCCTGVYRFGASDAVQYALARGTLSLTATGNVQYVVWGYEL